VAASKPRWEPGARAAIALKPRGAPAPAPAPAAAAWTLAPDEDGADELLDDEELLTEEDRARPDAPGADLSQARVEVRGVCAHDALVLSPRPPGLPPAGQRAQA
jgi:hypothetical protein